MVKKSFPVNTYVYGVDMSTKLSKFDWLNFSLKELAENGHSQLTAYRLATKLGVSRGSFYWHFENIRAFETEILQRWTELTTDDVINDLRSIESPPLRLGALIKRAMDGDFKLERAVRSWAISDDKVAKIVQTVDARRVAYITNILKDAGVKSEDLQTRAQMLNWAATGRMMMSAEDDSLLLSVDALNRFASIIAS